VSALILLIENYLYATSIRYLWSKYMHFNVAEKNCRFHIPWRRWVHSL